MRAAIGSARALTKMSPAARSPRSVAARVSRAPSMDSDHRAPALRARRTGEPAVEVGARPHRRPSTESCRKNTRVRSARGRRRRGAGEDERPARLQRLQRCDHVAGADGLEDGVDALGRRAPGSKARRRRADGPLRFSPRAARRPDTSPAALPTRSAPWRRRRRRPGPGRSSPGVTWPCGQHHPVGGQPRGRKGRDLGEGQLQGLGTRLACGRSTCSATRPNSGRRAPAGGVERLVAAPAGIGDHAVHDRLAPFSSTPGRPAEHHWRRAPGQADAAQREEVAVVQRRRPHHHGRPAVGDPGVRALPEREPAQRIAASTGAAGRWAKHAARNLNQK